MYKIPTTSRINLAKTHNIKIQVFQSTEKTACCVCVCVCVGVGAWQGGIVIIILSHSAENFLR